MNNFLCKKNGIKTTQYFLISGYIILLSGCSAMQTGIEKRNLEVSTKMSQSIFLDPVPEKEKTIYLDIHNTSDKPINIKQQLRASLQNNGYRILRNPNKAHYVLQVNTLEAGKTDPRAVQGFLSSGFGGSLTGAVAGATAGSLLGNGSGDSSAIGGLLGAGIGFAANALVKDVMYSIVTDVQIINHGVHGVTATENQSLQQGTSGTATYSYHKQVNEIKYRTRIVSTAEKMNLAFNTAKPKLENELSHSISGLFS